MSSIHSYKAQIAPFTFYIVEAAGGYMATDLSTEAVMFLNANTILADMGKTVVIANKVYRKVQIVTSAGDGTVGYICLNSDDIFGENQGVSKLN